MALSPDEVALVADLRRALAVTVASFGDAVDDRDWERVERWAAIGFGLVELMEGERADA